ncbi:ImmA/IrrE family metallo-endopeptidase [Mycobacteroides chelonae]|uniref:ImmA/IrrE family metallo-endopeptidase n=1 Tax=Mycobacteroides chelonae TaxID=1774 RepID=UPI0008A92C3A|nr:ImmA/IrrE family metallo-endopeptidase [Mycobacteroides chelonae]MBF9352823.1 ImmA/IrrE family metallo-endopeptidase [Mycobacteroides chelonae]
MANRVAHIAATQAHDQLGVDTQALPIETADAIARAGVELMYQPMPSLFGAYISGHATPGILINNRLDRAVRRHTAAHELGHHQLRHGTVFDGGADTDEAQPPVVLSRLPDNEKVAEAFAAWFLMPLPGVRDVLDSMCAPTDFSAEHVYQLSLRVGASYTTTARHLVSLQLARRADAQRWGAIPSGTLKRALVGDLIGSTRSVEVWDLAAGANGRIRATENDLLVLPPESPPEVDGPAEVVGALESGRWVLRCAAVSAPDVIGIEATSGYTHVRVEPRPCGLYVASPPQDQPTPSGA